MSNVAPTETRVIQIAATVAQWETIENAAAEAGMSVDVFCAVAVVDAAIAQQEENAAEQ